jgi:MFS family permease
MTTDLNVSINQLSNAQSAQLAGLAMGCIFFIPFTIKYGRRSTYIFSTALMAAVSWWTSRMTGYGELIATAVITGLSGAVNETAVQMTVSVSLSIIEGVKPQVEDTWTNVASRLPTSSSSTNVALPTLSTSQPS